MATACLQVFHLLAIESLLGNQLGRKDILQRALILSRLDAQRSIEGLAPGIRLTVVAQGQTMRRTTADLSYVTEAIDQSGHIARSHLWIARAQPALTIAPHSIHVTAIPLHKHCMLLSAADIADDYVETAYLGQVVNHLITAHTQLPIVII